MKEEATWNCEEEDWEYVGRKFLTPVAQTGQTRPHLLGVLCLRSLQEAPRDMNQNYYQQQCPSRPHFRADAPSYGHLLQQPQKQQLHHRMPVSWKDLVRRAGRTGHKVKSHTARRPCMVGHISGRSSSTGIRGRNSLCTVKDYIQRWSLHHSSSST